jgi:ribonuclease Y
MDMGPHALAVAVLSAVLFEGPLVGLLGLLLGIGGCLAVYTILNKGTRLAARREAERVLGEARQRADQVLQQAKVDVKEEYLKRREEFERESAGTRNELKDLERRLSKREDLLDRKLEEVANKERDLRARTKEVEQGERALQAKQAHLDQVLAEQRDTLLRITGMSMEEARELLLKRLDREMDQETAELIDKRLSEAKETADDKARNIIIQAIQRYAAEQTCEGTVSTVEIPSDDMKGRVIGREGRNIRAFEKATGVDVIVDDTPGVIVVSGFDPVRREVARMSMERLIQDGRIHPARIEEIVAETQREVDRQILDLGKKAAMQANIHNLHRKELELLGRLHFRTSYGQNVLQHSIEVAYLCQVMADELGLDGTLARRCGLLHDIGKAVDHEVEGSHPQIGAELCKRFNEPDEVIEAITGHHGDLLARFAYTPLVAAADAISASRPGGRRESLERYTRRLEQLEELAVGFNGVRKAYAIQAGREVRVIVDANRLDDKASVKLAREIAKKVEHEMTYPGEVKITVLREVRAVEYAR